MLTIYCDDPQVESVFDLKIVISRLKGLLIFINKREENSTSIAKDDITLLCNVFETKGKKEG